MVAMIATDYTAERAARGQDGLSTFFFYCVKRTTETCSDLEKTS